MQDFHLFRQFEFNKCARDLQLPCRWAPDAAFGYGEPLFNFYTQMPYLFGEIFHLLGFQIIDSVKIIFLLTIVLSGIGMYLLANQLWKNKSAAILSSVLYMYAPYRALDVWVRAALPEAMAFIIFPLIVYFANKFISNGGKNNLLVFSLLTALLVITHNLSLLMFALFLSIWILYSIIKEKKFNTLPLFVGAGVLSAGISAFYLFPVIVESKFINLIQATIGYYDFRGHFAGLQQMLFSRFWGYGASLFGPDDDLGLSSGQIQWILPSIGLVLFWLFRKKEAKDLSVLVIIGWLALFLAHNKSTFIWEAITPLSYLQFPWRWLAVAAFSFALAGGGVVLLFRKHVVVAGTLIFVAIVSNLTFFHEDIWYSISDKEQFSDKRWGEQQASALGDYWPVFAKAVPGSPAPQNALLDGEPIGEELGKNTNSALYKLSLEQGSEVQFPIAYFPGWIAKVGNKSEKVYPSGDLGLATVRLPQGESQVTLNFVNTKVRIVGNLVSILSIALFGFFLAKKHV